MPDKTFTSSPSSPRRSSEPGRRSRPVSLICPADLPGLSLSVAYKSDHTLPRHAHDSFIVGVATAGARRIETTCECALVRAGDVFVLAPGLAHNCRAEPGGCAYLAFSLTLELLPSSLALAAKALPLRLQDAKLARALTHLAETCENPAGPFERQSLLAEVLELLATHAGAGRERPKEDEEALAEAVRLAKRVLADEEAQQEGIGLPALAQTCGADMYALHRAFTRIVGLPPHAFQTHQRLRRAKKLLRAGASLTDAALAAGFCDQSHMHRHFTRLVGLTPAQYAKAHMARG